MGMRSDDGRGATVEVPAERDLFAGGLSVHIDEDEGNVLRQLCQLGIHLAERIVDRRQEDPALKVEHGELYAVLCGPYVRAATWAAFREIPRPQKPRLVRHVVEDLFAIPAMVAPGQHVNTVGQQVVSDLG